MIEVKFEKVAGGYLMNDSYLLGDWLETPEGKAAVARTAQAWADDIDAEIAAKVYEKFKES